MSTRAALPLLAVLAVVVALVAGRTGSGGGGPAGRSAELLGHVERVVDGDTAKVRLAGGVKTVRYIGIDTPESVKPDTPVQCFGKEAAAENERLVEGEAVRLVVGVEPRDRFGRLLAYVYRSSDGLFVNEELVRGGFAEPLDIRPNVRFASRFHDLADAARGDRRGLYGAC